MIFEERGGQGGNHQWTLLTNQVNITTFRFLFLNLFLFFSFFLLFYSSLSVSSPHLSSLFLLSVHSTFHLQRFEYIYIYIFWSKTNEHSLLILVLPPPPPPFFFASLLPPSPTHSAGWWWIRNISCVLLWCFMRSDVKVRVEDLFPLL